MGKRNRHQQNDDKLDATGERLARAVDESGASEAWDFVNPSLIDSRMPIGMVRRFKASHLDRFYRRDSDKSALTWRQYYAGDWYRNTHAMAAFSMSVIASYGERVSTGEPSYGMPRTERQAHARKLWREAKEQFPPHMRHFMDGLLLHDFMPAYASTRAGVRGRLAILREIGVALDSLADWLRLGVEQNAA